MHLWTEYEGRTVAEQYTLGKLLRSEGRNGFFATSDQKGRAAVIRLTEAHFDEAEQLRRWRHIAEVHQDNLICIEQVGQTTLESVALTYALMEPDDANLGDVLKERPLTSAETLQVAKAVLAALQALHRANLVHEHVEPGNVFAVGETVKLRSDCARECVVDGEFITEGECADLRRKDLHDFGKLLLRCLTLETEWSPAHNNLPDPFKRVIPRALDGTWSMEQLGTALDPSLFAEAASVQGGTPASATVAAGAAIPPAAAAPDFAADVVTSSGGQPPAPRKPLVPPGVLPSGSDGDPSAHRAGPAPRGPVVPTRDPLRAEALEGSPESSRGLWIGVAVAVLLILLLGWHFLGGKSASTPGSSNPPGSGQLNPPSTATQRSSRAASPAPAEPASRPTAVEESKAVVPGSHGWHVIAYTYNHEAQAESKVRALRRRHNSLEPQLFTPTGAAPFFVALGGAMGSQDEAEAVYRHARRAGLPRDTFVRHY